MKRSSPWLVAIPLMLAGSQVAHTLAYRSEYPNALLRARVLAATGHRYLDYLPLVLGLGGAVLLLSLVFAVDESRQGRTVRALPAWAFALVSPLGFTLQELSERALHGGAAQLSTLLGPTFLVGLLLQLPFGLVAFLVARLLLRAAARVGRVLAGTDGRWKHVRAAAPARAWSEPALARRPLLAQSMAERGPPAIVA